MGAVIKKLPQEMRSVMVLFDNLEYLIIGHLCGLVGAALKKFCCNANITFH